MTAGGSPTSGLVRIERRRSAAIARHDTAWLATLYSLDLGAIAANISGWIVRRCDGRWQLVAVEGTPVAS